MSLFRKTSRNSLARQPRAQRGTARRRRKTFALLPGAAEQLELRRVLSATSALADADTASDSVSLGAHSGFSGAAKPKLMNADQVAGVMARVVNGEQTGDFPAVGFVGPLGCTGTLISPTHVLTAAHCMEGVGQTEATFVVNGQTYQSKAVTIHENYNPNDFGAGYDIAIVELDRAVEGVAPMKINRDVPTAGTMLTLVGFGEGGTSTGGFDPNDTGKQVGQTELEVVTQNHLAWNFDSHNEANTAPGDSGGPQFINNNGELVIASVTSGGTGNAQSLGDYSFNTRIDTLASWIDNIVGTTGDETGGETGGGETGESESGTFTSTQSVNIPDNSAGTVSSTLDVNGLGGNITDVNITLDINHTWNEDVTATLISPSGTRIELFNAIGGSSDNFSGTMLDDDAPQNIADGNAPFNGVFRPAQDLASLDGEDPNGTWTLEVNDSYPEDGGRINSFSVSITTDAVSGGGETGGGETGGGETGGDETGTTSGIFTSTTPIAIPENDAATIVGDQVVDDLDGEITDVNVQLDIAHSWNEDLQVTLISPSGTRIELFNAVGGSSDNFVGTILDDQATTPIGQGSAPFTGAFVPSQSLAVLNGENPNGTWQLEVTDTFAADGGVVTAWTLDITTSGSTSGPGPVDPPPEAPPGDGGGLLSQQAIELDQEYGFYTTGNLWEDWAGANEKWFKGEGNEWYYVLPDGGIYHLTGSSLEQSEQIATLSPDYHANPELLYNAADATPFSLASLDTMYSNTVTEYDWAEA